MIEAWISVEALELKITGHAGYAERGKDIVCAGVSMLTQTLAAHMLRHAEEDLVSIDTDNGMMLRMKADSPRAGETRDLFAFVQEGLELLSGQYPEYVSLHTD